MKNTTRKASSGVSISTVLTLIFVVLKLTGLIDWSWVWVLSPVWISAILCIVIIVLCVIFSIISKK